MAGFTKPTVELGIARLKGQPARYTDKMEFLSTGVVIGFKDRPSANPAGIYPSPTTKVKLQEAAVQARNIVRIANDEIANVVILRRPETQLFTDTMKTHFHLIPGDTAGGLLTDNVVDKPFSLKAVLKHDRRWVLEKIRQMFLSLSFHLNTGVYLIDIDAANRTVDNGRVIAAGTVDPTERGYVYQRGAQHGSDMGPLTELQALEASFKTPYLCGFNNGEIHLNFSEVRKIMLNSSAKIIIHEAAHKYLGVDDHFYAWNANYPNLSMANCLDNADSIAWAAVSLATGGVKMSNRSSRDNTQCQGGPL